jgi:hypothetical protein
VALLENAI